MSIILFSESKINLEPVRSISGREKEKLTDEVFDSYIQLIYPRKNIRIPRESDYKKFASATDTYKNEEFYNSFSSDTKILPNSTIRQRHEPIPSKL